MRVLKETELNTVSGGGTASHIAVSVAVGSGGVFAGATMGFIAGTALAPVAGSVIGAGIGTIIGLGGGVTYYLTQ